MDIPKRVRVLRQARGISVAQLAKAAGVSQPYLGQIEAGVKKNPSAAVLLKLAKALRVTVADIIGSSTEIPEKALRTIPASLRELARKKGKKLGLRQEDIEMLGAIHYRGAQPETADDWELIYLFIRRLLG